MHVRCSIQRVVVPDSNSLPVAAERGEHFLLLSPKPTPIAHTYRRDGLGACRTCLGCSKAPCRPIHAAGGSAQPWWADTAVRAVRPPMK
jgi:hypothetical protein